MNRVAITGVGAISCLGNDREIITDSLYRGVSGIVCDPQREQLGFRSPLTGIIRDFDPSQYLSRKARKTMTLFAIHSYAAAVQAIEHTGLERGAFENSRTGLIFGCDSSCLASYEQASKTETSRDTGSLGSGYIFRSMTSNVTMNLNILLKTRGASWTIGSACSSSGHAVGQAADLIRSGKQDKVICGGAQEINWQFICSLDSVEAISAHTKNPQKASRPFSHDRDGLVPSGGAAAIILEDYNMAQARGANILGEIRGYGFSSDGYHICVPAMDGLRRAMEMALQDASTKLESIDHVSAHATSTPAGDKVEAMAIDTVFGQHKPGVASLKGMTGHEFWMAGAAQVVYVTLMAAHGFTAANVNFAGPDEHSSKLRIITENLERPPRTVLCNSAGFGGTNASLVIQYQV